MPQHQSLAQTISRDAKSAAIRAFFNIADKWNLSNTEAQILLGRPTDSTFYKWKRGEVNTVPYDTIERISYVLGIFKALEYLYTIPENADSWIKKPNTSFGGQSALDRMMGGSLLDLATVRSYLDSIRGGW